jgi:hypothetical protein
MDKSGRINKAESAHGAYVHVPAKTSKQSGRLFLQMMQHVIYGFSESVAAP